ncbi:sulfotransferase [Synechococcus sp. PCC 7336]|uniref:sulfotransferase n=1 Tax=Synechococcus sp. PCC 7336 TaxID=195250 RepID=UPI00034DD855|nr:sulfotransferase [Synechococcus sp. PCC 7336]
MNSIRQNPWFDRHVKPPLRWLVSRSPFRTVRSTLASLRGTPDGAIRQAQATQIAPSLAEAIAVISKRWPDLPACTDTEPIFIFSAGWRSGSTLLQRMLMSSGDLLIWGEPYGHAGAIANLAAPLRAITHRFPDANSFANEQFSKGSDPSDLAGGWVANLYPEMADLKQAHIAFFKTLFEAPARSRGIHRWGVKEVRWEIDFAIYLQWLFPSAKFLFLYRNPYRAYLSYRRFDWYDLWPHDCWYDVWPNQPIDTPERFGRHWKRLLEGYLAQGDRVNGRVLKYEDLAADRLDLDDLESFLGLEIDRTLQQRSTVKGIERRDSQAVTAADLVSLQQAVEPIASQLGYEMPQSEVR